jgi:hypothetical protein
MMPNVFWIDGLITVQVVVDYIDGWALTEDAYACGVYIAETRGQAKAMFCDEWDFEWTDKMSIRLLKTDVNHPCGRTFHFWDLVEEL